jgi:demethylmenaquinone methyltransferase/2-methoxy-6-polyprenyl-1,4-benzoquinol methylase
MGEHEPRKDHDLGLLDDYSRQAESYDRTRGASPSVLAPVQAALTGAPGVELLDVGGGTGNYALALRERGWRPLVLDRSPQMLARAGAKGLPTLEADAHRLPFADESFDAATMLSTLHHLDDPGAALAEAQRVLRPGGRLAVLGFTREDIADAWVLDYFPSSRPWMEATHHPLPDLLGLLPGAGRVEVTFSDLADASLAALMSHPRLLLEERWRVQTSYFERMHRDHRDELNAGLERLQADLDADSGPTTPGRASVLAWSKPPR